MGRRKKLDLRGYSNPQIYMDPDGAQDAAPSLTPLPASPRLNINRAAYSVREFHEEFETMPKSKPSIAEKCLKTIKKAFTCSATDLIRSKIPIFDWLPRYNFKEYLLADIVVGITLAVFQAPQCMGYSLIAHVPPIHGIYSAFFPTLVYTFLGTSRHSAVGGEVMLSGVMTGNIVIQVMEENGMSLHEIERESLETNQNMDTTTEAFGVTTDLSLTAQPPHPIPNLHSAEIASAIGFIIGIIFPIMSFLRLGFVSIYLSEQFLSGCITAASVYAFSSQLRYLLGVHLPYRSGFLAVVITFVDVFVEWRQINVACVVISLISIIILLLSKIYFNPWLMKFRYSINFPIELIVVILGTALSYFLDFNQRYGVPIVGPLPAGIPPPEIPRWSIIKAVGLRTVPCMLYSFTITLSIGKLYGAKHGYTVDPNQELIALGASNILGSLFTSIPASASLPRSATQETAGGKTQIASLVNCVIMLFMILFLSPLLASLPTCILASIIAVALRSLLAKVKQFHMYWKVSKVDGAVWLVTFFAIIILDMELGLYLSLAWSLLTLIYKSSRPKTYLLGSVNKSDVYVPLNKFRDASETSGIKIYQFCGPLHFASFEYFKNDLSKKIGVNLSDLMALKEKETERKLKAKRISRSIEDRFEQVERRPTFTWAHMIEKSRIVIADCSMISYIDCNGVAGIKKLAQEFETVGIKFFLASCAPHVITMLSKDHFFSEVGQNHVFISVHDAVLVAIGYLESENELSVVSDINGARDFSYYNNGIKERYRPIRD